MVLVAGDAAALCVAGVALGDIHLRFKWQPWQLVTSTFVLVAGVALGWLWCHSRLFHTPSLSHTIFHTHLCHTPSLSHAVFHTQLSHTHTHTIFHTHNFVTHHLSHTTLSHTTLFYFLILHLLLCLSFLPRPRYNIWCSLLEEVALWGYPVL